MIMLTKNISQVLTHIKYLGCLCLRRIYQMIMLTNDALSAWDAYISEGRIYALDVYVHKGMSRAFRILISMKEVLDT